MNGQPSAVPKQLRRLVDSRRTQKALDELEDLLFYQGGAVCSAATAALPFLVAAAAGASRCAKLGILELIGFIASDVPFLDEEWIDPGWPAAWQGQLDILLTLVDDPDPDVRVFAAETVAATPRPADAVMSRLQARYAREPDAAVRARLVTLIGEMAEAGTLDDHAAGAWLDQTARGDVNASVRLLARLARPQDPTAPADVDHLERQVPELDLSMLSVADWAWASWTGMLRWVSGRLEPAPGPQRTLLRRLATHPRPDLREGAAEACAAILATTTVGQDELADTMLEGLLDSSSGVRGVCAAMVAALAPRLADDPRTADRLAALLSDRGTVGFRGDIPIAAHAAWGLATLNDPRCLPYLRKAVQTGGSPFDLYKCRFPRDSNALWLPAIDEVLALVPAWAAELTPLLLPHLSRISGYDRQRAYAEAAGSWGTGAAAAIPALTRLLRTGSAQWAAQALAAIGPPAAGAATALARLAHRSRDGLTRIEAAAAHHRVTGDPGLAVRVLSTTITDYEDVASTARRLADIGPAAKAIAPALSQLVQHPDNWVRVEAQHALWCIDAQPMDRILNGLDPEPDGTTLPMLHRAVSYLARHTAPEPTRAMLQALLDHPHRLSSNGSWRGITTDLQIRADARTALGMTQADQAEGLR